MILDGLGEVAQELVKLHHLHYLKVSVEVRLKFYLQTFHLSFVVCNILDLLQFLLEVKADVTHSKVSLLQAVEVLHVTCLEYNCFAFVAHAQ